MKSYKIHLILLVFFINLQSIYASENNNPYGNQGETDNNLPEDLFFFEDLKDGDNPFEIFDEEMKRLDEEIDQNSLLETSSLSTSSTEGTKAVTTEQSSKKISSTTSPKHISSELNKSSTSMLKIKYSDVRKIIINFRQKLTGKSQNTNLGYIETSKNLPKNFRSVSISRNTAGYDLEFTHFHYLAMYATYEKFRGFLYEFNFPPAGHKIYSEILSIVIAYRLAYRENRYLDILPYIDPNVDLNFFKQIAIEHGHEDIAQGLEKYEQEKNTNTLRNDTLYKPTHPNPFSDKNNNPNLGSISSNSNFLNPLLPETKTPSTSNLTPLKDELELGNLKTSSQQPAIPFKENIHTPTVPSKKPDAKKTKQSSLTQKPSSKHTSSLETENNVKKALEKYRIAPRYLNLEKPPKPHFETTGTDHSWTKKGFRFKKIQELIPLNTKSGKSEIESYRYKTNLFNLEYKTSKPIEDISDSDRFSFICAGRKLDAFFPEDESGHTILVLTREEYNQIIGTNEEGKHHLEYLIIDDIKMTQHASLSEDQFGHLHPRRLAVLYFIHKEKRIKDFFIMDDNIGAFYSSDKKTWEDIYAFFREKSENYGTDILMSRHYSPKKDKEEPHSGQKALEDIESSNSDSSMNSYSSKVFFMKRSVVDIFQKEPQRLSSVYRPWSLKHGLEDLTILINANLLGLKTGSIHRSEILHERAPDTRRSIAVKNVSALEYLHFSGNVINDDIAKKGFLIIKRKVEEDLTWHQKEIKKLQKKSLSYFMGASEEKLTLVPTNEDGDYRTKKKGPKLSKKTNPSNPEDFAINDYHEKEYILKNLNIFLAKQFKKLGVSEVEFEHMNHQKRVSIVKKYTSQSEENKSFHAHQLEAVLAFKNNLEKAKEDPLLGYFEMATRSGKSYIISLLLMCALRKGDNPRNVMLITPRIVLADQIKRDFIDFFKMYRSDFSIDIKDDELKNDVLIVSSSSDAIHVDTFLQLPKRHLGKIVFVCGESAANMLLKKTHDEMSHYSFYIFDESHLKLELQKSLKSHIEKSKGILLGFSATPSESKEHLKNEIFKYNRGEAFQDGVVAKRLVIELPYEDYNTDQDYDTYLNSFIENAPEILKNTILDDGQLLIDKKGIIRLRKVDDAKHLTNKLLEDKDLAHLVTAVYGDQSSGELKQKLYNFTQKEGPKILIVVEMAREGYTAPVDYQILLSPHMNQKTWVQSSGRSSLIRRSDGDKTKEKLETIFVLQGSVKEYAEGDLETHIEDYPNLNNQKRMDHINIFNFQNTKSSDFSHKQTYHMHNNSLKYFHTFHESFYKASEFLSWSSDDIASYLHSDQKYANELWPLMDNAFKAQNLNSFEELLEYMFDTNSPTKEFSKELEELLDFLGLPPLTKVFKLSKKPNPNPKRKRTDEDNGKNKKIKRTPQNEPINLQEEMRRAIEKQRLDHAYLESVRELSQTELHEGGIVRSRVIPNEGDGNCGFLALGITREEFANSVLEHWNDQETLFLNGRRLKFNELLEEAFRSMQEILEIPVEDLNVWYTQITETNYWLDAAHLNLLSFVLNRRIYIYAPGSLIEEEPVNRFVPYNRFDNVAEDEAFFDALQDYRSGEAAETHHLALFSASHDANSFNHFERLEFLEDSVVKNQDDPMMNIVPSSSIGFLGSLLLLNNPSDF